MKSLEKISGKTCVWKVHALKSIVVTEKEEKCRYVCDNEFQKQCNSYRPIELYHIRLKGIKEYYRKV